MLKSDKELEELENKINRLKSGITRKKSISNLHASSPWSIAIEIFASVGVGVIVGLALERLFNLHYFGLVISIFIGAAAGFKNIILKNTYMQYQDKEDKK